MSNGKAPGTDGILAEVFKKCSSCLLPHLVDLFEAIWNEAVIPQDFKDATIFHIYKRKGDRSCCDNHWGISTLDWWKDSCSCARGLSDHRLLQWSAQLMRPAHVYTTTTSRPWSRLDADAFRAALLASPLCQPDTWSALDVDDLVQLYDDTIAAILDDILPLRTVRCRRRTSDPWLSLIHISEPTRPY